MEVGGSERRPPNIGDMAVFYDAVDEEDRGRRRRASVAREQEEPKTEVELPRIVVTSPTSSGSNAGAALSLESVDNCERLEVGEPREQPVVSGGAAFLSVPLGLVPRYLVMPASMPPEIFIEEDPSEAQLIGGHESRVEGTRFDEDGIERIGVESLDSGSASGQADMGEARTGFDPGFMLAGESELVWLAESNHSQGENGKSLETHSESEICGATEGGTLAERFAKLTEGAELEDGGLEPVAEEEEEEEPLETERRRQQGQRWFVDMGADELACRAAGEIENQRYQEAASRQECLKTRMEIGMSSTDDSPLVVCDLKSLADAKRLAECAGGSDSCGSPLDSTGAAYGGSSVGDRDGGIVTLSLMDSREAGDRDRDGDRDSASSEGQRLRIDTRQEEVYMDLSGLRGREGDGDAQDMTSLGSPLIITTQDGHVEGGRRLLWPIEPALRPRGDDEEEVVVKRGSGEADEFMQLKNLDTNETREISIKMLEAERALLDSYACEPEMADECIENIGEATQLANADSGGLQRIRKRDRLKRFATTGLLFSGQRSSPEESIGSTQTHGVQTHAVQTHPVQAHPVQTHSADSCQGLTSQSSAGQCGRSPSKGRRGSKRRAVLDALNIRSSSATISAVSRALGPDLAEAKVAATESSREVNLAQSQGCAFVEIERHTRTDTQIRPKGFEKVFLLAEDSLPFSSAKLADWVTSKDKGENATTEIQGGDQRAAHSKCPLPIPPAVSQSPAPQSRHDAPLVGSLPSVKALEQKDDCGPIWSLSFNRDLNILACGTKQGSIFLWHFGAAAVATAARFRSVPRRPKNLCREFLSRRGVLKGHTTAVVCSSWGRAEDSPFLLSCSLDRSVRVWNAHTQTAICIIRCADWPISAAFAPNDHDDLILIATLDGTTQLWRLRPSPSSLIAPLKAASPKGWRQHSNGHRESDPQQHRRVHSNPNPWLAEPEIVACFRSNEISTCLSVSPRGFHFAIGSRSGKLSIYSTRTFTQVNQIDCRNRRGRSAGGEKITGIEWLDAPSHPAGFLHLDGNGDISGERTRTNPFVESSNSQRSTDSTIVCVTTNDSRIRLVEVDKSGDQILKLKGHVNQQLMLRGQFESSGQFLIAPSEDNQIFCWDLWECTSNAMAQEWQELRKEGKMPQAVGETLNLSWFADRAQPVRFLPHQVSSTLKKRATGTPVASFQAFSKPDQLMTCLVVELTDSQLFPADSGSRCASTPRNISSDGDLTSSGPNGPAVFSSPHAPESSFSALRRCAIICGSKNGAVRVFVATLART